MTQKKFVSTEAGSTKRYCWDAAIHLFWCGWVGTIPYYPRANETKISCKSRKGWRWNTFSPKPWLHIIQSKLRVYIRYINHSATAKEKSEGKSYSIGSYPAGSRLLRGRFFWPLTVAGAQNLLERTWTSLEMMEHTLPSIRNVISY